MDVPKIEVTESVKAEQILDQKPLSVPGKQISYTTVNEVLVEVGAAIAKHGSAMTPLEQSIAIQMSVLMEEVGEAAKCINDMILDPSPGDDKDRLLEYYSELKQVAAVALMSMQGLVNRGLFDE